MAIAAVLGAIVGAIGTLSREVLANRFGKQARSEDREQKSEQSLWQELRGELTELRKEVDTVRTEVDLWKSKYWALMDEHLTLKAQYIAVQKEVTELRQLVQPTTGSN